MPCMSTCVEFARNPPGNCFVCLAPWFTRRIRMNPTGSLTLMALMVDPRTWIVLPAHRLQGAHRTQSPPPALLGQTMTLSCHGELYWLLRGRMTCAASAWTNSQQTILSRRLSASKCHGTCFWSAHFGVTLGVALCDRLPGSVCCA